MAWNGDIGWPHIPNDRSWDKTKGRSLSSLGSGKPFKKPKATADLPRPETSGDPKKLTSVESDLEVRWKEGSKTTFEIRMPGKEWADIEDVEPPGDLDALRIALQSIGVLTLSGARVHFVYKAWLSMFRKTMPLDIMLEWGGAYPNQEDFSRAWLIAGFFFDTCCGNKVLSQREVNVIGWSIANVVGKYLHVSSIKRVPIDLPDDLSDEEVITIEDISTALLQSLYDPNYVGHAEPRYFGVGGTYSQFISTSYTEQTENLLSGKETIRALKSKTVAAEANAKKARVEAKILERKVNRVRKKFVRRAVNNGLEKSVAKVMVGYPSTDKIDVEKIADDMVAAQVTGKVSRADFLRLVNDLMERLERDNANG